MDVREPAFAEDGVPQDPFVLEADPLVDPASPGRTRPGHRSAIVNRVGAMNAASSGEAASRIEAGSHA